MGEPIVDEGHLEDLLLRISQGDRRAFDELYADTHGQVYGIVRRVLRDPDLSADVVQEAYLQMWDSADKFDATLGSPWAWIFTLARRRAVDAVRREQRLYRCNERHATTSPIAHDDAVEESVMNQMEYETVLPCLNGLSDLQRDSIRMAYYEGLTYRQVAEKLGVGLPTVKSRIRDGLRQMRVHLST